VFPDSPSVPGAAAGRFDRRPAVWESLRLVDFERSHMRVSRFKVRFGADEIDQALVAFSAV